MNKNLASVKYVGPAMQQRLEVHGISSLEQLAGLSEAELAAIPGIGLNTAPLILMSARALVVEADGSEAELGDDGVVGELATGEEGVLQPEPDRVAETGEDELAGRQVGVSTGAIPEVMDPDSHSDSGSGESEAQNSEKAAKKAKKQAKKAKKAAKKARKALKKELKAAEKVVKDIRKNNKAKE